jgi:hypothetical protein
MPQEVFHRFSQGAVRLYLSFGELSLDPLLQPLHHRSALPLKMRQSLFWAHSFCFHLGLLNFPDRLQQNVNHTDISFIFQDF